MRKGEPLLLCLLLGVLYVVLAVASLTNSLGTVFLVSVATYVIDDLLVRTNDERILMGLNRLGASIGWRFFCRQVFVLVFVLRSGELSRTEQVVLVLAVMAHRAAVLLHSALRLIVNYRRGRRLETRNLPVAGDQLPPEPPHWQLEGGVRLVPHTELLWTAGLGIAFFSGSYTLVAPSAALMAVAGLAISLTLVPQVVALRRLPSDDARLKAAQQALKKIKPVVVLYFSGEEEAVYQVNMWLETMERLGRNVLVVVRERRYLAQIAPTTVPLLCVPFSIDFMNFELPTVRAALYVSNVGKNIHLLRLPSLKSAFIGHGDSDKTASFNPFSKVYDEVWVAGEAGRQRYLRAQVGVREDEIVIVGRPQLDRVQPAQPRPGGAPFTVLYAPTWEGWTDDKHHSSLIVMGREIVRLLLGTPGVCVMYKPHPLTGSVKPEASRVSAEIVDMMARAGPHHVAVVDATPLYDCFNESDALVSDISSVVSDYLRSEKPYFVTNGAGLPEDEFRDRNPSAGAAYLVGPSAKNLAEGLAAARGTDPLRARRAEVRTFLLGGADTDAMTLFRRAVDNLIAKAEARRASTAPDEDGDDDEVLKQAAEAHRLTDARANSGDLGDG